jgi:peptidoglycan/LPS O-acetylase OafA/YrhL
VLSGFLLSRPWLDRHARRLPAPPTGRYLWKRLLRILPVYVVAVVAALLLLPGNNGSSPALWVKTLTLSNLYLDDRLPEGLTQMWSLATEVAFYVALPGIMWLALSRRRHGRPSRSRLGTVLAVLVVVNAVWLLDLAERLQGVGTLAPLWLPSFLTWFAVGIALAACSVHLHAGGGRTAGVLARVTPLLEQLGRTPGVCWTAALALFAVSATPLAGPSTLAAPSLGEALVKNLLYAVVAGLLVLSCVFGPSAGRFIRLMSLPLLRHLGHISYGVFCVHLVVLELVTRQRDMELFEGRTLELFALTLVISLLVAELLYRLVERPALRFKDLRRPRSARSVESSSPNAAATNS